MSNIFKNTVKSFTSDITGETKEYRVNNAVWIYMEELFGYNQSKFDEQLQADGNTAMVKFATAVLKANGLDVTFEEVAENTTPYQSIKFYNDFFDIAFNPPVEELKEKAKKTKEGVQKDKA